MVTYLAEKDWQPADGLDLEEAAIEAVKSKDNTLIIAGPGAGKTELLAQRACFLLETNKCTYPHKILAISFKRDAAKNLSDRVKKRCGNELASQFDSMTYDAFAKQMVDHFLNGIPKLYRPKRNYQIAELTNIREAFNENGFKHHNNRNSFNETLHKLLIEHKLPINNEKVLKVWQTLLRGNDDGIVSSLSFPMITRLAEYLLRENSLIKRSLQITYKYIFLDEFQDTTAIQYDLLKTCFLQSNCILTAVGDTKQRIMVWAGALVNVFDQYSSDFAARELRLLRNYRSVSKLIEIQKLIQNMIFDQQKKLKQTLELEQLEGTAMLYLFDDYLQEAEQIANIIQNLIHDGLKATDICIIVKQQPNIYGKEIINRLKEKNIEARNENLFQDLLTEEAIGVILDTLSLSILPFDPDAWTNITETIYLLNQYDEYTDISTISHIQEALEFLLKDLSETLKNSQNEQELYGSIKKIINFFNKDSFKRVYPKYNQGDYFDEIVQKLVKYLWKEYQETFNWMSAIKNLKGNNSIPIMTIHKSKGLEYEAVFFIGLEDAAFWNYINNTSEDNCAFFVALSRAKSQIYFTFCRNRPTRFDNIQTNKNIGLLYEALRKSGMVKEISFIN